MGRGQTRRFFPGRRKNDAFWNIPARFNFTRDVVEGLATDPLRSGMTFVDREGVIGKRTFATIAGDAGRWAGLFRSRGLLPGDRVLVMLGQTPAWHGVMLGALKAGIVTIPCSEMLPAHDLTFRAQHAGARLLVADSEQAAEIALMDAGIDVLLSDEWRPELAAQPLQAPTHDTGRGDVAFILYTSGTTRNPKGVTHTHAFTWAARMQAQHWLDARPGDIVWCTARVGWTKSIWNSLLGPWSCGAQIVLHEGGFDPEERFELIQRLGVTVLCQTPTEYRLMAKLDRMERFELGLLRLAVSAGEPLSPEVIGVFRDTFGLTIYDGYGQTETTLLVANTPGLEVRPGSMGLPTPGHEIGVIDEEGAAVPTGVEGDLALRGHPPSLFAGYWNEPEETAAVRRRDWYVTGDRARRDDDGYLWFAGRADDVILSAAHRIGPFEVESVLLEHPAVAESAVIGKPDPDSGQIVKAFVVLRSGHEASDDLAAELQEHVKTVTVPYKAPREIEFVDELPKTPSGKIRRAELRRLEAERAAPPHDVPIADEPIADEPIADEPKADEPKADEPKADEPKADEPIADEPPHDMLIGAEVAAAEVAAAEVALPEQEARAPEAPARATERETEERDQEDERRRHEVDQAAAEQRRRDEEQARRDAEAARAEAEAARAEAEAARAEAGAGAMAEERRRTDAPARPEQPDAATGGEPGATPNLVSRLSHYGRRRDDT